MKNKTMGGRLSRAAVERADSVDDYRFVPYTIFPRTEPTHTIVTTDGDIQDINLWSSYAAPSQWAILGDRLTVKAIDGDDIQEYIFQNGNWEAVTA